MSTYIFTNASPAFDYDLVTKLVVEVTEGRITGRIVATDDQYVATQVDRYLSDAFNFATVLPSTDLCPLLPFFPQAEDCPLCSPDGGDDFPCIVIPGSDKFSLWDCECDECHRLQKQAETEDDA